MASVTITWTGSVPDRAGRERLIAALEPFAAVSNALLTVPEPPLRLDGLIEGTVLVLLSPVQQSRLTENFGSREALSAALGEVGGALVSSDWTPPATDDLASAIERAAGVPLQRRGLGEKWFLRLPKAELHGIQWLICDPRFPFEPGLTVGFVHLVLPGIPHLDGLLVEVQGDIHNEAFDDPSLGPVDCRLARPNIHLRYYLESWFERFLSWVRFFHVPDLRTEGHCDDAGWYGFERQVRYLSRYERGSRGDLEAAIAAALLRDFGREAGSWGLARSHPEAEAARAEENARLCKLLETAEASERPLLLRALTDALKEHAWLLEGWPNREDEFATLLKAHRERRAQLESERTPEEQLISFAEERLIAGTWCPEEDDERRWEEALSAYHAHWDILEEDALTRRAGETEAGDPALADARNASAEPEPPVHPAVVRARALTEGIEALSKVPAARRPPGLEAHFRLQLARKALGERAWVTALEEAERAISRWEVADGSQLVAADWKGIAVAHSVAADAREGLGRPEEAVERLHSGLERLREGRADVTGAFEEEAAAFAALGMRQRALGRAEDARASFLSAEDVHLALLGQADGSPWLWRDCRMDVLQHVAELEAARGEPSVALRHLATLLSIADEAGARPVAALRLIAEIELRRGRYAEAAEAARDGLEAVYPRSTPPSPDAAALDELLRDIRRLDSRALADAPVSGAPS